MPEGEIRSDGQLLRRSRKAPPWTLWEVFLVVAILFGAALFLFGCATGTSRVAGVSDEDRAWIAVVHDDQVHIVRCVDDEGKRTCTVVPTDGLKKEVASTAGVGFD